MSRMVAIAVHPDRAAPTAAASPMPEDVPVIRTVFEEVMRVFLAWGGVTGRTCKRGVPRFSSNVNGELPDCPVRLTP
ncbi:hypothetical protein SRO_0233 [Streptomyces rochei]|nr:hypothetical protein SRO_0233 [Streptomyces rochei]